MWKLGLRPRNSQKKKYINRIFLAVCSTTKPYSCSVPSTKIVLKIPAQVSTLPAQLVSIQVISSVYGFLSLSVTNHRFSLVHSPIKCKCRICLNLFMYVRTWEVKNLVGSSILTIKWDRFHASRLPWLGLFTRERPFKAGICARFCGCESTNLGHAHNTLVCLMLNL